MSEKTAKLALLCITVLVCQCSACGGFDVAEQPYLVNVPLESRSITFENPTGEKGKGGMAASKIGVGRKGKALANIDPGQTITLCNVKGPGVIRRMWATLPSKKENLLGFVIRGYWDGQKTPSIEVPIGYFFGSAHGITKAYQSAVHSMTDTAGMSLFLQMAFTKSAKFTITNEGAERDVPFYYQIDLTLNEKLPADVGRLHVLYHRENPTTRGEDFTILKRAGMGRFLGCIIGINNVDNKWWGEGEVKMYLDGDDKFPTICGTGTEDYIGHAWGFHENAAFLYGGMAMRDDKLYTLYRWHLPDPIYWKKDIRVTLQQIGAGDVEGGGGYYNKQEDVSAAAFWYEPVPSAELPKLLKYAERIAPGYAIETKKP